MVYEFYIHCGRSRLDQCSIKHSSSFMCVLGSVLNNLEITKLDLKFEEKKKKNLIKLMSCFVCVYMYIDTECSIKFLCEINRII